MTALHHDKALHSDNQRSRTLAWMRPWLLLGLVMGLSACTTQTVKKVNAVKVMQANAELSQTELLDIGVSVFDPGVSMDPVEQKEGEFNQGITSSSYWLRFSVETMQSEQKQWLVEIAYPNLDHVNVTILILSLIHI